MSKVFSLINGKGGLTPQLKVIAPVGSTVTANGLSPFKTEVGVSTSDYYFKVSIGTYSVVATLGTQTATETVVIDTVKQYEIEITYGE